MNPIVNTGIKAARRAGNIILRHIDQLDRLSVQEKGRNDFVSDVDRMAEEDIIDTIHYLYPNHRILAEESGTQHSPDPEQQDNDESDNDEFEWIIDPLDGTTNFLHGNPNFAVSIGIRHKGRIEHGIIFDPLRDELFTASRGQGAQLNNRRIRITGHASMQQSIISVGYPNIDANNFDDWLKCFRSLLPKVASIRHSGSVALDLAYVASGRTDAFWQPDLKIWDLAAGSLLVREAKGLVADFDGNQNFLENGGIIAANPGIFNELMTLVIAKLGTKQAL